MSASVLVRPPKGDDLPTAMGGHMTTKSGLSQSLPRRSFVFQDGSGNMVAVQGFEPRTQRI